MKLAYQRKTRDRWDIETNYGYGWEVENSEYNRGGRKAVAPGIQGELGGIREVRCPYGKAQRKAGRVGIERSGKSDI